MRRLTIIALVVLVALAAGTLVTNQAVAARPSCNNRIDDDHDGLIDYPDDPGCVSRGDRDETDPPPPVKAACENGLDDDSDGLIDYPQDPGCDSPLDTDETDVSSPGCSPSLLRPSSALGLGEVTKRTGLQADIASAIVLGTSPECLTWAPPGWNGTGTSRVAYTTNQTTAQAEVDAKYPGYTALILNDTGNLGPAAYTFGGEYWSIYLPNNQDFVLLLNHRNLALGNHQGIEINGGRNVVLIGGTITGNLPTTGTAYDSDNQTGIDLRGHTGTLHIEGVLLDGYFIRGIRSDPRTGSVTVSAGTVQLQPSAPARYQFENIRAPNLSMWKHNSGGHVHMDFWILSGSTATQYISAYADKITASWDHAGMASFHNDDTSSGWFYSPFNYWKRTNFLSTKVQCPAADHDYSAYALSHSRDTTLVLDDFWLRSGWNYSGLDADCPAQTTQNTITGSIIQCDNRDNGLNIAVSSDATHYAGVMTGDGKTQGNTLTFTDPAVDKVYGPGQVSGGVIHWGIPPGGDFVPDGIAGTNYVSPGYLP